MAYRFPPIELLRKTEDNIKVDRDIIPDGGYTV